MRRSSFFLVSERRPRRQRLHRRIPPLLRDIFPQGGIGCLGDKVLSNPKIDVGLMGLEFTLLLHYGKWPQRLTLPRSIPSTRLAGILWRISRKEYRAAYGKKVLDDLSNRLSEQFGAGWSVENLKLIRRFYSIYGTSKIGQTAITQSSSKAR
ncbi:MAG: DUF1016 N-terminal domain-containing protein, partial [Bacteroidales bacterium]|nr:DUF1016 N-terminal domain-containing protein [Bacteroidales bacterium]